MAYRQHIDGCLSEAIGHAGLTQERLSQWLTFATPRFKMLGEAVANQSFAHFRILAETADLVAARQAYARLLEGADTVIVLGTGGSSLGGQALAQLGGWSIAGDDGPTNDKKPRLRFYDNLDVRSFSRGLQKLDFLKTRFIVISKSGTTAETLAQTLTIFSLIEKQGHGASLSKLFLGVTEPSKSGVANGLRHLFETRGIPLLEHNTEIGGRYSVFTNVGLLPALARGLDIAQFRKGGLDVVQALENAVMPEEHAAAIGAALAVGLAKDKGVTNTVIMPYCDRLERFAAWYVQLWAESLGKKGEGSVPIATLGPVDQHSQLQLYMDGPNTQLLTIIRVTDAVQNDETDRISEQAANEAGAPYLAHRTIGDLVRAQQKAISTALIQAKRPVRIIDIDRLDEYTLGALMMHFMIETIIAADLLNVDPFDQPAVELGKVLTRQYLAQ